MQSKGWVPSWKEGRNEPPGENHFEKGGAEKVSRRKTQGVGGQKISLRRSLLKPKSAAEGEKKKWRVRKKQRKLYRKNQKLNVYKNGRRWGTRRVSRSALVGVGGERKKSPFAHRGLDTIARKRRIAKWTG